MGDRRAPDTSGLFPPLSEVLDETVDVLRSDSLTNDILPSVARALAGFVLGSAAAIALGVVLGWWRALEPWTTAPLEFLRAVPVPGAGPARRRPLRLDRPR